MIKRRKPTLLLEIRGGKHSYMFFNFLLNLYNSIFKYLLYAAVRVQFEHTKIHKTTNIFLFKTGKLRENLRENQRGRFINNVTEIVSKTRVVDLTDKLRASHHICHIQ